MIKFKPITVVGKILSVTDTFVMLLSVKIFSLSSSIYLKSKPTFNFISDILNIKLCSRRKKAHAKDNSTSVQAEHLLQINETTAYRNWTCFLLIKASVNAVI